MNQNAMQQQLAIASERAGVDIKHLRQRYLFSTYSLRSVADATGRVPRGALSFFSAKKNTAGQGFSSLHGGLTNFTGSPNVMPPGLLYMAKAFGVRVIAPTYASTPRHAISHLLSGTTNIRVIKGDSTYDDLGPMELWPAGIYGPTSRAVAAVAQPPANGALTLIDYPNNGERGLRAISDGSEFVFKPGGQINITLELEEEFFLTDDGQPAAQPEQVRDLWVQTIFDGFTSEQVNF